MGMLYASYPEGTTTDFSDNISGNYTVSFWTVFGGSGYPLQSGQWEGALSVAYNGNIWTAVGPNQTKVNFAASANVWNYVTLVASATDGKAYYYLNGELKATENMVGDTFSMGAANAAFAIGGQCNPVDSWFANGFAGSMADFRIYGGALTATQIAGIMAESGIVAGSSGANEPESDEPAGEIELIAHYEFEDEANLGKDSTANGNNLLTNGEVTQGRIGVYFEGGSSMLYAPKADDGKDFSDSIAGDYSVSFWLAQKVNAYIIQSSSWESGFSVASNPSDIFVKPGEGTGSQNVIHTAFTVDKWMHVTVVASTTDGLFYLYVNGSLIGSAALVGSQFSMASDGTVFAIGGQANPTDNWFANGFTGSMADVRIYSGALTAEQVVAVMGECEDLTANQDASNNKIITEPETDGELIAHYEFKDATNIGKDSAGNYDLAYVKNSENLSADAEGGVAFGGAQGLYAPEDFSNYLTSYTLSLWVKVDNSGNPGYLVATGGYENKFNICAAVHNLYIAYGAGSGTTVAVPCVLTNDAYTNIVISASNELGIVNIYKNGEIIYTIKDVAGKVGMQEGTFAFAIGCQADENGDSVAAHFTGSVKDVRVYNGMIKSATAKSIYENAQITYPVAPSIVTDVNLINSVENTSDVMMDAIGSNVTVKVGESTYTAKVEWLKEANGALRAAITQCDNSLLVGKVATANMQYVLNLDVVGNGSVLVNGAEYNGEAFNWNEDIEFTLSTPEHYRLVSLYNGVEEITVTDGKAMITNMGKEIVVSFEAIKYQIVLRNGEESNTLYYDVEKTITLPVLEDANKTFLGWYASATFEGDPVQSIAVGSFGDKEFYAKWLISCAVEYVLDGGVNGDNPEVVVEGEEITLEPASKEGFTFVGWFTDAQFTTTIEKLVYAQEGYTLYAKYEVNMITVTFVANGGSKIEPLTVAYGSTITLPDDPVKEGYIFDGWYVDEECTQLFSSFSALTSDITLYANYTEDATANLNSCKGSLDSSIPALIAIIGLASIVILKKRKG